MVSTTDTVRQFKAAAEFDPDEPTTARDRAEAATYLRDRFRDLGMSMATDPEASEPEPVTLNAARDGWTSYDGSGFPDGYVITWTATGADAITDPDKPLDGSWNEDCDLFTATVTPDVTTAGGPVRVRHGYGGEVIVKAWRHDTTTEDGTPVLEPVNYLFAQPLTDDEAHVELLPGATHVTVEPDPESED